MIYKRYEFKNFGHCGSVCWRRVTGLWNTGGVASPSRSSSRRFLAGHSDRLPGSWFNRCHQGVDVRWRSEGESKVDDEGSRMDRSPSEGMEAKLRQLLRLKDEKLITEEEYTRKRAEILEKW